MAYQPAVISLTLSHPDYTVGSGLSPDQPYGSRARNQLLVNHWFHTADRELVPRHTENLTLPRRS
jgi:hypothetical protein